MYARIIIFCAETGVCVCGRNEIQLIYRSEIMIGRYFK